jgi:hypothetical protein
MQSAKLYSFTNLWLLACLLTPAMAFLLVLMSYHEKAQDGQTACTLKIPSFSSPVLFLLLLPSTEHK